MTENADNMFDQWFESIADQTANDQTHHELEQTTVINLSNPQVGDVFTLLPNEFWEIVRIMPLAGDVWFNRAILLLKNAVDDHFYTLPQRLNGNLERRTLRAVPHQFLRYLKSDIDLNPDFISELQYMMAFADTSADFNWSEKHGGWSTDVDTGQSLRHESRLAQIQWAIEVQGAGYRGPFLFVQYTPDDKNRERYQSTNYFIYFNTIPITPQPDITRLDHLPRQIQPVTIDPSDLHKTARILSKHFNLKDLIKALHNLQ